MFIVKTVITSLAGVLLLAMPAEGQSCGVFYQQGSSCCTTQSYGCGGCHTGCGGCARGILRQRSSCGFGGRRLGRRFGGCGGCGTTCYQTHGCGGCGAAACAECCSDACGSGANYRSGVPVIDPTSRINSLELKVQQLESRLDALTNPTPDPDPGDPGT